MSPGDWLVRHRAPAGLLEASRHPRRTRSAVPVVLLAAAAGMALGAFGARVLESRDAEGPPPGTRPVTLVYHATDASRVDVAGSFNDWDPGRSPLHPIGEGAFRTVLWLPPGQYEYQFVVDGRRWQPDPLAVRQRDDGFGAVNSVLEL
jgi:1,4-alpha-glucan branching enzyme